MSKDKQVAVRGGAMALVDPISEISKGVSDLLLAFPAGAPQAPENRTRLFEIYFEAMRDVHPWIVSQTISWLMFNNQRNPFPPTPQDVRETARKIYGTWFARVGSYFRMGEWTWGQGAVGIYQLPWGGAPGGDDCVLPADLLARIKREHGIVT